MSKTFSFKDFIEAENRPAALSLICVVGNGLIDLNFFFLTISKSATIENGLLKKEGHFYIGIKSI